MALEQPWWPKCPLALAGLGLLGVLVIPAEGICVAYLDAHGGTPDGPTLRESLERLTLPGTTVVTDQHAGYNELKGRTHIAVNHSKGQYVDDEGYTTNSVESHWAVVKRVLKGIFHQVSVKHLPRYLAEFMWCHNHRAVEVLEQMGAVVRNMAGRQLRLQDMRRGGRSGPASVVELDKPMPLQPELFSLAA